MIMLEKECQRRICQSIWSKIPASPTLALPMVTFNDTISFHLNEEEIVLFTIL